MIAAPGETGTWPAFKLLPAVANRWRWLGLIMTVRAAGVAGAVRVIALRGAILFSLEIFIQQKRPNDNRRQ